MKTSRDDGIKQFSIHTFLIIQKCHVLWGKICKMVLYTELFYAIFSLLVFILFAVLLSLHLHTFLMFFTLVRYTLEVPNPVSEVHNTTSTS